MTQDGAGRVAGCGSVTNPHQGRLRGERQRSDDHGTRPQQGRNAELAILAPLAQPHDRVIHNETPDRPDRIVLPISEQRRGDTPPARVLENTQTDQALVRFWRMWLPRRVQQLPDPFAHLEGTRRLDELRGQLADPRDRRNARQPESSTQQSTICRNGNTSRTAHERIDDTGVVERPEKKTTPIRFRHYPKSD
ncbi:hypothetical protein [Actinoplanes sp. L3-i22]|uniref:hypothetical protein n=1 Tax=Actinoplanes sp. L3-i22 TaxID=2836373 RepID=UPI001C75F520|nr:hypothetical protein [Actinoplanes sp. L3-i22]BCY11071.1 hypothetical protein L3i22_061590 [Actinoplanes sp. L3-i22]